ncbi:YeeE/YedE family protein [Nereida sp. MMG025]|uniref:YeeE/YedE family protein n=1 Tax=Nereida sp. MMG025 TaxID=2909981 RepID=UPI001F2A23AC|nr:YeeE/YedE family protein [Nereida sp. MMG025]MCF6443705.1 YeeE/YedE family protein [Nereida sp. MMG025]
MHMDWIYGLLGGLMIGCAGAVFLLVNGRVMGASGIAGSLVDGSAGKAKGERLAFVIGLIAVPAVIVLLRGGASTYATTNLAVLVAAGLCVGVGTRLANGCTSGHGVCGISRLSMRGIVATLIYIGAGGVTVAILRMMGAL